MGTSKKPRKKHVPRVPRIPLMKETHDYIALDMRMTVEKLIALPSVDTYNEMSLRFISIGKVLGKCDSMERAKRAMLDIAARFERMGKFGVSEREAEELRAAAGELDGGLRKVTVDRMFAAERSTMVWCQENGITI